MEIRMNQAFTNIDGTVLKKNENEFFYLKSACVDALTVNNPEEKLSGEDKIKRWDLAVRIYNTSSEISLSSEEISLLKKLISNIFGTIITAQSWKMLEG